MKTLVPAVLSATCVGFYLSSNGQVDSFIIAGPALVALQGTAASHPAGRFHSRLDATNYRNRVACRMTNVPAEDQGKQMKGFGQPRVSGKTSAKKKGKTEKTPSTVDSKQEDSERRQLFLQFECNRCDGISQFMINKNAYENGIVICTCQKCGVRHLLADNLKKMDVPYFGNNIEEYMQSIGSPDEVTKGTAPGLTPEVLEKFDVSVGADGVLNLNPK